MEGHGRKIESDCLLGSALNGRGDWIVTPFSRCFSVESLASRQTSSLALILFSKPPSGGFWSAYLDGNTNLL
jgi:hypothetical protein